MKKTKIIFIFLNLFIFGLQNIFSQEISQNQKKIYTEAQQKLKITSDDVFIEKDSKTDGFHLYIRKKEGVESVLLTETAKDPNGKEDNYAYRADEYNEINGDEIRLLDGKQLVSENAKYSLVDSTVEETSFFGKAFHIYIPKRLSYGYEWTRHGSVEVENGFFVNIRSFGKPYADYSGNFMDSSFMFSFIPKKKTNPPEKKDVLEEPNLTNKYNPIASMSFKEIDNELIYSKGPESLIDDIEHTLEKITTDKMDLVFVIDSTGSMKNDMDKLKSELIPSMQKKFAEKSDIRFGLVFYRDYGDNFNYKNLPIKIYDFTSDFKTFQKNLNSVKILGREGGDVPEAVYEAIFGACEFFKWQKDFNRQIILIGDAQPHSTPRGTKKYSKDFVMNLAKEKEIKIHTILLPED